MGIPRRVQGGRVTSFAIFDFASLEVFDRASLTISSSGFEFETE